MISLLPSVSQLSCQEKRSLLAELLEKKAKSAPLPEIPAEYYQIEYFPEYLHLKQQQQELADLGLGNPFLHPRRELPMIGLEFAVKTILIMPPIII